MNQNISDDVFLNDPIFAPLRKFASESSNSPSMSPKIHSAFKDGIKVAKKRRFFWRGAMSALAIGIAFPTLAVAKILPAPLQKAVNQVSHVITAPVAKILGTTTEIAEGDQHVKFLTTFKPNKNNKAAEARQRNYLRKLDEMPSQSDVMKFRGNKHEFKNGKEHHKKK